MRKKKKTLAAQPVQLIYAGGTFGSYGKPLTPIDANTLKPLLLNLLSKTELPLSNTISLAEPQATQPAIHFLDNACIKDSSQLTPIDFVYFYKLLLASFKAGNRQFVIITGTDTLSYLGAFLAEAFAHTDISIVLTGSMRPLFNPDIFDNFVVDDHSDAWDNLQDAIGLAGFAQSGVRVAFGQENWHAQTVQKIHSQDLMAFTGHQRAGYPANSYANALPPMRRQHWIDDQYAKLEQVEAQAAQIQLPVIYATPNPAQLLASQLAYYLTLPPTGIILIGFGAGNLPYSAEFADLLDKAYEHGHILVSATQSAFGGVSDAYASGSWQYEHQVISGGRLTIAAIYGRLLWLHLSQDTPARRRARWRFSISQTDIVRS